MPSFLTTTPLFSRPLTARMSAPYLFDLLSLLFVLAAWLGFGALKPFGRGDAVVVTTPMAFALIGSLGIYGVRLAMWVAILRRNRRPQVLEWLVCLLPLAATVVMLVGSGAMVRAYASGHGYHRCADTLGRHRAYVYAATGRTCPTATDVPTR